MKDGLPEYGILPIDPLAVNSLSISQGDNSPINLKQEYKNVKILHISTSTMMKYRVDFNKFILRSEAITPVMEFLGDYTMDGRILLLPITGKGKSNITLTNLMTKHEMICEPFTKNGETYLRMKDYRIKLIPERMHIYLENLFNGDKTLSTTMNTFLNENWEIVFNELKSGYEDTFGYVFKDISNKLFSKVPMRKIFFDEL